MKRTLATLAISLFALNATAVEVTAPYEQLNIDRALPNIDFPAVPAYVADARAPFEQLAIDRALPNLSGQKVQFASTGSTRSDASTVDEAAAQSAQNQSPWANDEHFTAPPQ
jgi:hypothetical protein